MSHPDSTRTPLARQTAITRRRTRQAKLTPQPLDIDALARELAQVRPLTAPTPLETANALAETRASGGATIWRVPTASRGRFIVSLPLTRTVPLANVTPRDVSDIWQAQLNRAVSRAYQPHSFGLWVDGPTLHVDINTSTNGLVEALTLARDHNQLAVWDNVKGVELTL